MLKKWNSKTDGTLSIDNLISKFEGMGYDCNVYTYSPGTYFGEHSHEIDKIDAVLSGKFKIVMDGEEHLLTAGDYIHIPRSVIHTAEVIGNEAVVSIDACKSTP